MLYIYRALLFEIESFHMKPTYFNSTDFREMWYVLITLQGESIKAPYTRSVISMIVVYNDRRKRQSVLADFGSSCCPTHGASWRRSSLWPWSVGRHSTKVQSLFGLLIIGGGCVLANRPTPRASRSDFVLVRCLFHRTLFC